MIVDKKSLYLAFQRNGYYMPRFKEAFITIKFLVGAKKERYFLPKTDTIKKRQCADPPAKKVVADECAQVLQTFAESLDDCTPEYVASIKRTAIHLSNRPANVDWMLDVIASIHEEHEYFHKDYQKPKKVVNLEMVQ